LLVVAILNATSDSTLGTMEATGPSLTDTLVADTLGSARRVNVRPTRGSATPPRRPWPG
jgi:hypothetical protein